jgi:hypothetical protein
MNLVLEHDKRSHSPLLYNLGDIVGLAEGDPPSWYQSQEVLNSSLGHAYSVARNYFHLQKSIRWGLHSID